MPITINQDKLLRGQLLVARITWEGVRATKVANKSLREEGRSMLGEAMTISFQ